MATETNQPELVELDPPITAKSRFGTLGAIWRTYRHHRKRKKLRSKGYIQWYLVDDSLKGPMFVKPKYNGGGIRELKHGGCRYLFPDKARVPSEREGFWTFIHRRGEADPINLPEYSSFAIGGDELEQYLSLRVSTSPPSFFDRLDLDAQTVLKWGMVSLVLLAIVWGVMQGGVV